MHRRLSKKTGKRKLISGLTGRTMRETISGYAMAAPFTILLIVFYFYVFAEGFLTSLTDTAGIFPGEYIGFSNYKELLFSDSIPSQEFYRALKTTAFYWVGCIVTQIPVAFTLAFILNHIPFKRIRVILRTAFFLPVLINTVVIALLFRMMFNKDQGIINWVLGLAGLPNSTEWLLNSSMAVPIMVFVSFWQWTGFHMVYFLSPLQTINPSIYEAAKLDGASPFTILYKITLPMMRPAVTFVVVTSTIACIQMFDLVFMIFPNAQYGPGGSAKTLVALIYDQAFSQQFRTGFASAIGWVTFIIIFIISLFQLKLLGFGKQNEES